MDKTPAQRWLDGSTAQLSRFWGGRCVTCLHWTVNALGNHGTCAAIGMAKNDSMIDVGRVTATTKAEFGCVLWTEIAGEIQRHESGAAVIGDDGKPVRVGQDEADAEMTARADRAIRMGLLDAMPDGFGGPRDEVPEQVPDGKALPKQEGG